MREWRAVPGWETLYEVSSDGQVRRVAGGQGARAGWVLRPKISPDGYLRVILCRDGHGWTATIHSLVCWAFHGPRPAGQNVAHGNGDKSDNRAANLRWATHAQNLADKNLHGTAQRGSLSPSAKLTEEQVRAVRAAREAGTKLSEIASEFEVSVATASRVANRRAYA